MVYILAISILFIWAVLILMMVRQALKKPLCPECGGEDFEPVEMRTALIEQDGEQIPAAWMYRRCQGCRARLKWDVGQNKWVELEPGEWEEMVQNTSKTP